MTSDIFHREKKPLLILLSGTPGSGKDSVVRRMKERNIPFEFVVNVTSRPPRPDEVNGRDYTFISETEFQEMIRKDELLEHAVVYNQHKGVPRRTVHEAIASGKDVVLRVDVQGAATIRRQCPEAVTIFLAASSEKELSGRLLRRGTDTAEQVALRLRTAQAEMLRIPEYDYVVVNADGRLDETVDTIVAIMQAEHARAIPRKIAL
jgi:guanylate kinase